MIIEELRVRFTPDAASLLGAFAPGVKRLLRPAINDLRADPERGSEMVGEFLGYRSLRVRRYRVICFLNDAERWVEVHHLGHRRDAYETLRTVLSDWG